MSKSKNRGPRDPDEWVRDQNCSAQVKSLRKEIRSLKQKLEKGAGLEALLVDAVRDLYRAQPDLTVPQPPRSRRKGKGKVETAVLHISDTQIGKVTPTYDTTVAEERLCLLVEKAVRVTEIRRAGGAKIDHCRVYLGGDMVEGETIFPGQAHHIDSSVLDQAVKRAPEILAGCIRYLLEHFRWVRVVAVVGNHGRPGRRGDGNHPRTNWDRTCYEVTKLILGEGFGKRLEFLIPDSWYAVDNVMGWGNLIIHGDQVRGGFAGFPWYGVSRRAQGWKDAVREPWQYLWLGHFHTYASWQLNYVTCLANGTTESSNEYAQSQLAAAGWPCQRLCFFNEEHGRISDHQIHLASNRGYGGQE